MRKKILIEEDSPLNGIEVNYPFCFKTKKDTYGSIEYHRYLEDGRFESIYIQELQMTMSYGNRTNTIYSLVGDHEFYFKQLALKHEIISQEEFEDQRKEYYKRYEHYLEGARYIASEVEQMISESEESQRKEFLRGNGVVSDNKDDLNDQTF